MTKDLEGRIALVTGAASGIGRAIASNLAARGATVAIADIDASGGEGAAAALTKAGFQARSFSVDVTQPESIAQLRDSVTQSIGIADLIVNGAGWNVGRPFLANELDFMAKVTALNFMGPVLICHSFLKPLVEQGKVGSVVNVSSDAGRVGSMGETVYAGAKGGIIAFTKSLAREMAKDRITVNCVAPGPTDTPLFAAQPEKIREALIRAIPMRRLGTPAEIANVVAFLASPEAAYVTGQVISVSGGLTMAG